MPSQGEKPDFDPDVLLAIASMDYQAGRFTDAQRGYSSLLQIRPDDPHALHFLGLTEAKLGRREAALTLLARAIENNPRDPELHVALALLLRAAGPTERVLPHYGRAVRLAPDNSSFFDMLLKAAAEVA